MYTPEELNAKVHTLRELKRQAEELSTQIKNIENELKAEMDARKEYELVGDDWKITWNMVGSNRFSQSEFKEAYPALFKEFTKLSESRRFLLS